LTQQRTSNAETGTNFFDKAATMLDYPLFELTAWKRTRLIRVAILKTAIGKIVYTPWRAETAGNKKGFEQTSCR
jgi:hypothetical protein